MLDQLEKTQIEVERRKTNWWHHKVLSKLVLLPLLRLVVDVEGGVNDVAH